MASIRTTETQGNHDLFEAFGQAGCPICALIATAVSRYMGSTNYDSVSDPDIRRAFERSHGFCNPHAHQWLREAFVLGTAHIYRDVLLVTAEELRQARNSGGGLGRFRRGKDRDVASRLHPQQKCPACAIRDETEARLLKTLLKGLADQTFVTAFAASDGLCLSHLRQALAAAPDDAVFQSLRKRGLQTQETLIAQLNETIRKHDYRFRHEPAGEEKGSPHRAVAYVAGDLEVVAGRG